MVENTLNIISKPLPEHVNIRGAMAYK